MYSYTGLSSHTGVKILTPPGFTFGNRYSTHLLCVWNVACKGQERVYFNVTLLDTEDISEGEKDECPDYVQVERTIFVAPSLYIPSWDHLSSISPICLLYLQNSKGLHSCHPGDIKQLFSVFLWKTSSQTTKKSNQWQKYECCLSF